MSQQKTSRPLRRALAGGLAACIGLGSLTLLPTVATGAVVDTPITHTAEDAAFSLAPFGSYDSGVFDESAAEIVAYHAATARLFVVNANDGNVDVLFALNPANPVKIDTIDVSGANGVPAGASINSISVRADGLVAVAIENPVKTENGWVGFFDANSLEFLDVVRVGALPDMVLISPDGTQAITANEGEPNDDYTVDPEGSISVIALPEDVAAPAQADVRTATFHDFEADGTKILPDGVRVFGEFPHGADNPVSRNLEPEYVAVSGDRAYVTLQENNAIAVVELETAEVVEILPLGVKDHGVSGNGIDASDRVSEPNITTYPFLRGLYQPDAIAAYEVDGQTYLVTANEGDSRSDWGDYAEDVRLKHLGKLDENPAAKGYLCDYILDEFPGIATDPHLGRLNVSVESPFDEEAGCYTEIHAFGARSFTVWDTAGNVVFDSGDDFEQLLVELLPDNYNSNHSETSQNTRSDDKGPEPEGLTIGEIDGRTYVFIGFERVGGVIAYDITDPAAAKYVTYVNNRDFSIDMESSTDVAGDLARVGDLGAEGLQFISAGDSPNGRPLVVVGNEVSGTTTLFEVQLPSELSAGQQEIALLNFNDFHGRINADSIAFGATIEKLRLENDGALLSAAGDNIGASLFASAFWQDQPTLDFLNELGLDAAAVGNHEFDGGWADLRDRVVPASNFAQLGANVYLKGTDTPALAESVVLDIDGVQVGYIGVVTPDTAALVSPAGIADIEFGDPVAAVNRVAEELVAADVDVIVALYHEGSPLGAAEGASLPDGVASSALFERVVNETSAAVDVIFTAHTHREYVWDAPVPGAEGQTRPIVQTGQYAERVAEVVLTLDDGEVSDYRARNVPRLSGFAVDHLVAAFPALTGAAALVADTLEQAAVEGNKRVGSVAGDITTAYAGGSYVDGVYTGGSRDDRGSESTMGGFVANSLRDSLAEIGGGADLGIVNPGGLRAELFDTQSEYGASAVDALADGEISFSQANAVLPFLNDLALVTMTGAQLKSVLEEQWQRDANGNKPSRSYLQLGLSDNASYTYDPDLPEGERITGIVLDGQFVTDEQIIKVATFSFLAAGGDNFHTFAEAEVFNTGYLDWKAWVDYLAANEGAEPNFARRSVQVSGLPEIVEAGAELSFDVAKLDLTSQGSPANERLQVYLGSQLLDEVAVVNGTATVQLTVPSETAAGPTQLRLVAAPSGTEVLAQLAITVAAGGGDETPPVAPVEPTANFAQVIPTADLSGDGIADLLAVDHDGVLWLYRGKANGGLSVATKVGSGWGNLTISAPGDFNSDGHPDLLAKAPNGDLFFYAGNGTGGFAKAVKVGWNWGALEIIPAGDVTGDGVPDVLAIDKAGVLYYYAGSGKGRFTGKLTRNGQGWVNVDLYPAGDLNGDGNADILSIRADGTLHTHLGRGDGGFSKSVQTGQGWAGYELFAGSDVNGDGFADLYSRDATNQLWFYAGKPGGFRAAVQVGSGW